MFSIKTIAVLAIFVLGLTACGGGWDDDLNPSGTDERTVVEAGSSGTSVDQKSPDFTVQDTLNNPVTLYDELAGNRAVVLYFTMWCPVCETHTSHMRSYIIPDFPQVSFLLVDYVSGSVALSRAAQVANGYTSIRTLVDTSLLTEQYDATMGTTVVIDSTGIVRMNEDYKDGVKLRQILEALP